MSSGKKLLYTVLGILIAFVPLGLVATSPAFGEWDPKYYKEHLGFIPEGLVKFSDKLSFSHLLPDYSIPGSNDILGYYVSAIVGAVLVFVIFFALSKVFNKNKIENK